MLNAVFDSTTIPLLEKVAAFGERRQAVLASNIANVDTPNYHRRDLPIDAFQKALRQAIAERDRPGRSGEPAAAAVGDLAAAPPAAVLPRELLTPVDAPSPSLTFQDGNNRSIENEVMEMTKNVLLQSFAVELLNAQMGMIQAAIRGQA
jgi:flagellar basal-body rod protein FlgB